MTQSELAVVIVGWNRPASLHRLVHSLLHAEYPRDTARMDVHFALDHTGNSSVDNAMDAVVDSLSQAWPHGAVRVERRNRHAGLRDNILGAWQPQADSDPPALILEDDLELSSLWWHWVQACLVRYQTIRVDGQMDTASRRLLGISLHTPDDMNEQYINSYRRIPGGERVPACSWQGSHARARGARASSDMAPTSAIRFGQPCSWGALYFAAGWRHFLRDSAGPLRGLDVHALPKVPCPDSAAGESCTHVVVNRWGRSSWKRLLVIHMLAHGLSLVYPNLPNRLSFATNHVEPGTHASKSPAVLEGQRARHRVGLVSRSFCVRSGMSCEHRKDEVPFELPSATAIELFDFYCSRQKQGRAGDEALWQAGSGLRHQLNAVREAASGSAGIKQLAPFRNHVEL